MGQPENTSADVAPREALQESPEPQDFCCEQSVSNFDVCSTTLQKTHSTARYHRKQHVPRLDPCWSTSTSPLEGASEQSHLHGADHGSKDQLPPLNQVCGTYKLVTGKRT